MRMQAAAESCEPARDQKPLLARLKLVAAILSGSQSIRRPCAIALWLSQDRTLHTSSVHFETRQNLGCLQHLLRTVHSPRQGMHATNARPRRTFALRDGSAFVGC